MVTAMTDVPHAYSGEAILKGVTYSTRGGYCARFELEQEGWKTLQALDGGHFMMVLVPVANDGTPDKDAVEKTKRKSRAQIAGMLCNEPAFWKYLTETVAATDMVLNSDDAAEWVRLLCGVHSRSKIDGSDTASQKWDDLKADYDLWLKGID